MLYFSEPPDEHKSVIMIISSYICCPTSLDSNMYFTICYLFYVGRYLNIHVQSCDCRKINTVNPEIFPPLLFDEFSVCAKMIRVNSIYFDDIII